MRDEMRPRGAAEQSVPHRPAPTHRLPRPGIQPRSDIQPITRTHDARPAACPVPDGAYGAGTVVRLPWLAPAGRTRRATIPAPGSLVSWPAGSLDGSGGPFSGRLGGRQAAAGPDVRRCVHCGSLMTTSRYKRRFVRFVRLYACDGCHRPFEQDTRGFQAFVLALVPAIAAPAVAGLWAAGVGPVVPGLVMLLALWALLSRMRAHARAFRAAPVVRRIGGHAGGGRLLPRSSGRCLVGRILGGDSRFAGFLLGLSLGLGGMLALSVLSGLFAVMAARL